jgi:heptosyltransferase II
MSRTKASIVFGVFKGMGDLICAAPVILSELRRGRSVHLLLFPNATLPTFCSLIDFSPHQQDLHLHTIPTSGNLAQWKQFLSEMKAIAPEMVWISPHAPAADSSWKIPLVLRTIQLLFWKNAHLVGADTERLSLLLHRRLPADRSLPLRKREWSAYRLLRGSDLPEQPAKISFVRKITDRREAPPRYDLVIHPGANAKNRSWPFHKYAPLVSDLPRQWRIAFLGLPSDLAALKQTMPADRPVEYVSGSIRDSIETLASARMLLIMDSGNMHFAQVLGVPAVAVFGYTDPADIIDLTGCVDAVYEQRFPCQPCRKAVCSQPEIYCLNNVEPRVVADRLRAQWERLQKRLNPSAELIRISAP